MAQSAVVLQRVEPHAPSDAAPRLKLAGVWLTAATAVLLLSHATLVFLTIGRSLDFLFNDAAHRLGPGTDLAAYYNAGALWLHGQSIFADNVAFGYRYHPFLAMTVGATLAKLPFPVAYACWLAVFESVLFLTLLVFYGLSRSASTFLFLASLTLLFSPFYLDLYMGNASFVAAGLILFAYIADRSGMRLLFLTLLITSILIKPIGLVLMPWLLLRRRFVDAAVVAVMLVVLAAPYFFLHPQDVSQIIASNVRGQAPGWLVHAGNQGLHGFLGALFTRLSHIPTSRLASYDQLPFLMRGILLALPLILASLSLHADWRLRHRPEIGVFLWLSVYLLGFQDVWEHSYSILVIGLGLLWLSGALSRRLLVACAIGLALPTAFALYDVRLPPGPYDPEHAWTMGVSLLHHATKPIWLLTLFVSCLWIAYKRPPPTARTDPDRAIAS